jgi:hypothetical protein
MKGPLNRGEGVPILNGMAQSNLGLWLCTPVGIAVPLGQCRLCQLSNKVFVGRDATTWKIQGEIWHFEQRPFAGKNATDFPVSSQNVPRLKHPRLCAVKTSPGQNVPTRRPQAKTP